MALIYLLTVYSHFDVWAPEELTGNWADVPAVYAPAEYQINGRVALATTCPCSWLNATAGSLGTGLTDMLLLVPDSICPPACSGELTACAANFHNASGMLISERFNMPLAPPSPPQTAPSPPPPTSAIQDVVDAQRAIIQNTADRLGCSSSLPTSVIQSNMSTYLHEGVSWNYTLLPQAAYGLPASPSSVSSDVLAVDTTSVAINLTIYRQPEEGKMDCTKYRWVPLVYVIFVPIWLMLTIAWTWNTYYKNYQYSRDLHRLMCWVPVMEFIHGLLSLFNYFSCPWESILSLVYATFWSIVTILKEPVMLLCLLLVAKGWCITRHFLHRREVCIAGTILALLYASVSVQMSLQSPLATIPMVIMYLAMLVEISWSIFNNLRILKAQLLALRALGVDPRTTPAYTKYKMFRRLAFATLLYASLELTIHSIFNGRLDAMYWLFLALHQSMELLVAVMIGYTFRSQPFNILFAQVQQVAAELADQMLPTITTIEVKEDMLQGDNLIAWREDLFQDNTTNNNGRQNNELPPTLIIVNPGDTELPSQTPLPRGMSTRAQQAIANQRTAASAPPPPLPGGDIEMRGSAIGNIRADTTARALLAGTSQAPRNAATTDSQMPALSIVDGGEVSPRLPSGGSSQPSSPRSHQASPNTRGGGGGRAVVDPLANVPVDIDEEEMPESELQTM